MAFRLNGERIAVDPDPQEEVTESGLFVPESGQDILRYGTVTHIGSSRVSEFTGQPLPIWVSEGDRIFFHRHSGVVLTIDGHEHLILTPNEVYGVVDVENPGVDEA